MPLWIAASFSCCPSRKTHRPKPEKKCQPEATVLGVPCPTAIFTFGLLFWTVRPIPRHLLVIPLLWALTGSTAVFLFGVLQDLGLLISGLLGLLLLRRDGRGNLEAEATTPSTEEGA
jgi:hypothetical protein